MSLIDIVAQVTTRPTRLGTSGAYAPTAKTTTIGTARVLPTSQISPKISRWTTSTTIVAITTASGATRLQIRGTVKAIARGSSTRTSYLLVVRDSATAADIRAAATIRSNLLGRRADSMRER